MNKDIYAMKLHDVIRSGNIDDVTYSTVQRVPGGWIYIIDNDEAHLSSVFVPFNNEFQTKEKQCQD